MIVIIKIIFIISFMFISYTIGYKMGASDCLKMLKEEMENMKNG